MNRRRFITTTVAAAAVTGMTSTFSVMAADSSKNVKPEYYEWRTYTFKDAAQLALVEKHWAKAAIPALNRLGIKNVGTFREIDAKEPRFFVLIPYTSLEQFTSTPGKLLADGQYQKDGAEYLGVEAKQPAYDRIESSLMEAFAGMPKLEVPKLKGEPRIFVLRTYESHNEVAGKKKIEMFNDGGEIGIFKRVGLTPVFFGETVVGAHRPNLTYLLVFKDMAEHDKNWATFRTDPEWVKLKAIPDYADAKIVSKIVKTFLVPAEGSQI